MNIFGRKSRHDQLAEQQELIRLLEQDLASMQGELGEMREMVRHLDGERALLLRAVECLRPCRTPKELSEAMLDLSFRTFDLASFYVALVDWEKDLLHFPLFHEGGKARMHASRPYSVNPGLTGKAILGGVPVYIRTAKEAEEHGAIFTEAEKATGLIPQSWFGVPLKCGDSCLGLVAFMSFQQDAFTESRRALLEALARLLAMALGLQAQRPS